MTVEIPKVPLFKKKETEEEKEKRKERESEHERDRESEYERGRAYSEFISRREDDEDGGEGGVKEEDKEKEKEKRKEQAIPQVNLFTRMHSESVLFYFGELTHEAALKLLALIVHMDRTNPQKTIRLLINSPGGDVGAGVTLYQIIQTLGVNTLCAGSACSTAVLILFGGKERAATADSRIRIRKLRRPKKRKGKVPFVEIQQERELTLTLIQQLAKRTGKSEQTVKNYVDPKRITFMSPEEAQSYGIIDSVVDEKNDKDLLL